MQNDTQTLKDKDNSVHSEFVNDEICEDYQYLQIDVDLFKENYNEIQIDEIKNETTQCESEIVGKLYQSQLHIQNNDQNNQSQQIKETKEKNQESQQQRPNVIDNDSLISVSFLGTPRNINQTQNQILAQQQQQFQNQQQLQFQNQLFQQQQQQLQPIQYVNNNYYNNERRYQNPYRSQNTYRFQNTYEQQYYYVTKNKRNSYYHSKDCDLIQDQYLQKISLSQINYFGYRACKICLVDDDDDNDDDDSLD